MCSEEQLQRFEQRLDDPMRHLENQRGRLLGARAVAGVYGGVRGRYRKDQL